MAGNLFLRVRRPAIPPSLDRLILCGGHGSTALGSPIGGCLPFPVSGRVVKTRLVDGSYYAEALSEGFDPAGPDNSQGYITHVASRALIFIEADNPDIGLMVAIFVGMSEVSSNEITVYEGQHVDKGDQLGTFRFGGSTHCLVFRPKVNLKFDLHGQHPSLQSGNIPVRARIATIVE